MEPTIQDISQPTQDTQELMEKISASPTMESSQTPQAGTALWVLETLNYSTYYTFVFQTYILYRRTHMHKYISYVWYIYIYKERKEAGMWVHAHMPMHIQAEVPANAFSHQPAYYSNQAAYAFSGHQPTCNPRDSMSTLFPYILARYIYIYASWLLYTCIYMCMCVCMCSAPVWRRVRESNRRSLPRARTLYLDLIYLNSCTQYKTYTTKLPAIIYIYMQSNTYHTHAHIEICFYHFSRWVVYTVAPQDEEETLQMAIQAHQGLRAWAS